MSSCEYFFMSVVVLFLNLVCLFILSSCFGLGKLLISLVMGGGIPAELLVIVSIPSAFGLFFFSI